MTATDDSAVPRPNLEQLKRQSRELLAGAIAGEEDAVDRLVRGLPRLHGDRGRLPGEVLKLADAQLAVARENGFDSWPKLQAFAESGQGGPPPFLRAVLAVVHGDIATVRLLLTADPSLIHQRAAQPHRAQLLHYIGANGVENPLQHTPPNAVEICRLLLEAGAEPDGLCQTYGGGPNQTTLNLLISSGWPHKAGLQVELARVLIGAGAAVNGRLNDGAPLRTALDFGYTDTARALADAGARIDALDLAAGLGQLDALDLLWEAAPEDPPEPQGGWIPASNGRFHAFVLACRNGQVEAALRLADLGVDINSRPDQAGTGLQEAILWDRVQVVRSLLARGADPSVTHGRFQATALQLASYNGRVRCIEALLEHGRPAEDLAAALASAAMQDQHEAVRKLLAAGAERTQALEVARDKGLTDMVSMLEV